MRLTTFFVDHFTEVLFDHYKVNKPTLRSGYLLVTYNFITVKVFKRSVERFLKRFLLTVKPVRDCALR